VKITMIGTSTAEDSAEVELTIEYLGDGWTLKVGKTEFTVTDLEKSMEFLKNDFKETT
jgi:hypothetical protein